MSKPLAEYVFMPFRGELGHRVMWHAPQVYACPSPYAVCVDPGYECLYPNAAYYIEAEALPDEHRRGNNRTDQVYLNKMRQKLSQHGYAPHQIVESNPHGTLRYFVPPVEVAMPPVDLVICARQRSYGAMKNWPEWQKLIPANYSLLKRIQDRVFIAGAKESSVTELASVGWRCAWDFPVSLAATIAAMKRCRVALTTDNGLAHLAVMCGVPRIVMVTHDDGRTAPGYNGVQLGRFQKHNHQNSTIQLITAWDNPDRAIAAVEDFIN